MSERLFNSRPTIPRSSTPVIPDCSFPDYPAVNQDRAETGDVPPPEKEELYYAERELIEQASCVS
jgi:hypothetical protein